MQLYYQNKFKCNYEKNDKTIAKCKLAAFIKSPLQSRCGPNCLMSSLVRSAGLGHSCP